jgi:hypothetical protein
VPARINDGLTNAQRYYIRHTEKLVAISSKWAKEHPKKHNENQRSRRDKVKAEVLAHYGRDGLRCAFPECPITDPDMLEIDHINDNGAEERKKNIEEIGRMRSGINLYDYLKIENFPPGYQTLCCNHNRKKEIMRRRRKALGQ